MASGFVSGGTNEEPTERDEAWLAAQKEIDAKRLEQKLEPEGGKSLYETLQANKAAKQDAFEESIRLRNQFRSLDEDEVEFLDSVLESTRAKEAEVRKETSQQLDAFREQQRQTESSASQQDAEPAVEGAESWATGPRKRKKGRESTIGGVKLRRVSTSEKQETSSAMAQTKRDRPAEATTDEAKIQEAEAAQATSSRPNDAAPKGLAASSKVKSSPKIDEKDPSTAPSPPAVGLGLAAYSSDEDEGD